MRLTARLKIFDARPANAIHLKIEQVNATGSREPANIRIVLAGLRGEDTITELCRQESIAQVQYYSWSKEFLEAGKKRLAGDTAREANTGEVQNLRREARDLKEVVAEQTLELRLLKKSMIGDGENIE